MKPTFLIILVCVIFFCCKKTEKQQDPPPVACFTPGDNFVKQFETTNFKNCSSNFDKVFWTFGDVYPSEEKEPSHTWLLQGTHTVQLVASKNNVTSTASCIVHVGQVAVGNISMKLDNIPMKYKKSYIISNLYSTNNLTKEIASYIANSPDPPTNPCYANGNYNLVDAYTNFRIKIILSGDYLDPLGSNLTYRDNDTIITDEINTLTGPTKPTFTITTKVGTLAYTLSPLSYQ